jgi:hypothetical protein
MTAEYRGSRPEARAAFRLVRGPDPLETLPRSIRRPALFRAGRWVACPLPESGRPGVTRLEVVLWLPVASTGDDERPDAAASGPPSGLPTWDEVAVALGRPLEPGPLTVPRSALEALTPGLLAGARVECDRATVVGDIYPSRGFEGHGSTMARAARLDGGLLVALSTT